MIHKPDVTVKFFSILPPSDLLAQTIGAMANLEVDGSIFIGILHERVGAVQIKGLSPDFNIMPILHKALDLVSPRPDYRHDYYTISGKVIFYLIVVPNTTPTFVKGISYHFKSGAIIEKKLEKQVQLGLNYQRIGEAAAQIEGLPPGTDSKRKVFAQYLSALRLLDTVAKIVLPHGPDTPTDNVDGRVLQRMLICSVFDNMETYLGDVLFEIWLSNPQMLRSKAEITVEEVLRCVDMEEFIQYYARKRITSMAKGSIRKFISENPQISDLQAIPVPDEDRIDKLMQIRHLFTHRNGIVDDRFAGWYPGSQAGTEYVLTVNEILNHLQYMATIIEKVDRAAVTKYGLATT